MKAESRFVVDTNVLVGTAFLPRSVSRQAFEKAAGLGKLLLSRETYAEAEEVLHRKKFDKFETGDLRERFLANLVRIALVIDVDEEVTDCRDPKDNKFLELAVAGQASCIISGDADLIVLHPFRGIPIVTPRDFLSVDLAEE